jgi:hypothetical protein
MQGGNETIDFQKKQKNAFGDIYNLSYLGYGSAGGPCARGKTIDFQKNKNLGYVGAEKLSFEGFLGGHKVAKSK